MCVSVRHIPRRQKLLLLLLRGTTSERVRRAEIMSGRLLKPITRPLIPVARDFHLKKYKKKVEAKLPRLSLLFFSFSHASWDTSLSRVFSFYFSSKSRLTNYLLLFFFKIIWKKRRVFHVIKHNLPQAVARQRVSLKA